MPYKKRRRDEVQLNCDMPSEVARALDDYVEREGVTRKLVVEVALRRFIMGERAASAARRMKGLAE